MIVDGVKEEKEKAIMTHRLFFIVGKTEESFLRHCKFFFIHRERSIKTYTYHDRDKVNLSIITIQNKHFKNSVLLLSNRRSKKLTHDQLEAILNTDRIWQHLVKVGYVSSSFDFIFG